MPLLILIAFMFINSRKSSRLLFKGTECPPPFSTLELVAQPHEWAKIDCTSWKIIQLQAMIDMYDPFYKDKIQIVSYKLILLDAY